MAKKKKIDVKDVEKDVDTNYILRETGRVISGSYYDYQTIRVSMFNRIRDIVRRRNEGIDFDEVEEKKERKSYGTIYNDKNLLDLLDVLEEEGKLNKKERDYLHRTLTLAFETQKTEKKYASLMDKYIETEEIWIKFLSKIKGIGKVLATNLIKEFGYCERYEHVSSLWKHSGQHVTPDGLAPKLKKGSPPDYSPKLKTFIWKIGDCLMKLNFKMVEAEDGTKTKVAAFYRAIYDKEKARQAARIHPKGELAEKFNGYKEEDTQLSKGHAHNRALRKMRKIFLEHYWVASRELAGYGTGKPYQFEYPGKDGKVHSTYINWKEAIGG